MDLTCAICGEPWGADHIANDCPAWIADNFKRGAGCEECHGEPPDGAYPEELLQNRMDHARGMDRMTRGGFMPDFDAPAPAWRDYVPAPVSLDAPDGGDPVPAVCAGCGVSIVCSPDMPGNVREPRDAVLFREWTGGESVHYECGAGPFSFGRLYRAPDPDPDVFLFLNGRPYCPGCAEPCYGCGATIFARTELESDSYDPGSAFSNPFSHAAGSALCIACFEAIPTCAECGESFRDAADLDADGNCEDCREPDPACEECGDPDGPFNPAGLCAECAADVQADGSNGE